MTCSKPHSIYGDCWIRKNVSWVRREPEHFYIYSKLYMAIWFCPPTPHPLSTWILRNPKLVRATHPAFNTPTWKASGREGTPPPPKQPNQANQRDSPCTYTRVPAESTSWETPYKSLKKDVSSVKMALHTCDHWVGMQLQPVEWILT